MKFCVKMMRSHVQNFIANFTTNFQIYIKVSLATVKRAKQDLGWVSTTPHYCQLIRDANMSKRVEWCHKCISDDERFADVIWTDECTVQLDPHRKMVSRRKGMPKPLKA